MFISGACATARPAVVEHFVVETEFVGKGFGPTIVRALASALRDEFETETIVFSERVPEAHERFPSAWRGA